MTIPLLIFLPAQQHNQRKSARSQLLMLRLEHKYLEALERYIIFNPSEYKTLNLSDIIELF